MSTDRISEVSGQIDTASPMQLRQFCDRVATLIGAPRRRATIEDVSGSTVTLQVRDRLDRVIRGHHLISVAWFNTAGVAMEVVVTPGTGTLLSTFQVGGEKTHLLVTDSDGQAVFDAALEAGSATGTWRGDVAYLNAFEQAPGTSIALS